MAATTAETTEVVGTDIGRTSVAIPESYLLMVLPPKTDAGYASLATGTYEDSNPPGLPTEHESKSALIAAGEEQISSWRAKFGERGTLPDSPPTPDRVSVAVHPDFREELNPRAFFGDSTLGAFGGGSSQTPLEHESWHAGTDEYDQWLQPLHDHDNLVLKGILDRAPVGTDLGNHIWVRSNENDRLEILSRDGTSIVGPLAADCTKLVRWLGDYWHVDSSLFQRFFQLEPATPFGRNWTYNSLRKHPEYVAGWEWNTRSNAWIHADGHCEVHLAYGYLDVRDRRTNDMGGRYIAQEWPTDTSGTGLSKSDIQDLAVEWMREHPAKEWDHPLRPLFDQADEYGGPEGYAPLDTLGRYSYHGTLVAGGRQRYNRATIRYVMEIDGRHWQACPKVYIQGEYEPGTDPDADENGPFTVKVSARRTARAQPEKGAVVEDIQTFSGACAVATDLAE